MSEKEVMLEIWNERPHVSEISGEKLIEDMNNPFFWNQFMHICPKSIYGKFRTRKDNIMLGTYEEHDLQTKFPKSTRIYKKWDKFWDKYDELKSEYFNR